MIKWDSLDDRINKAVAIISNAQSRLTDLKGDEVYSSKWKNEVTAEYNRMVAQEVKNVFDSMKSHVNASVEESLANGKNYEDVLKISKELPSAIGVIEHFAMNALNDVFSGQENRMDAVIQESWASVKSKFNESV